jgi:hypothetical protein
MELEADMRRVMVVVLGLLLLPVWVTQIAESYLRNQARTPAQVLAAADVGGPVGGFGTEVRMSYLKLVGHTPATARGVAVPAQGTWRTTMLTLKALHTRGEVCGELLAWAPYRGDARYLCEEYLTRTEKGREEP